MLLRGVFGGGGLGLRGRFQVGQITAGQVLCGPSALQRPGRPRRVHGVRASEARVALGL